MSPAPPSHLAPARLPQLDVIRAFAITLVLMFHTYFLALTPEDKASIAALGGLFRMGEVGVPLFFVLSGFLIGGLLIQEISRFGGIAAGRFLIRRGFKIYPPFYLTIGAYASYLYFFEGSLNWERLLREIFFVQNYGAGGLIDVSWSLGVEEHFYLLFVLVTLWLTQRPVAGLALPPSRQHAVSVMRPLVWLAVTLVVVCWGLRCLAFLPLSSAQIAAISPTLETHFRIDALFVGAALAWARVSGWDPKLFHSTPVRACLLVGAVAVLAMNGIPSSDLSLHFKKTHYLVLLTLASSTILWLALGWQLRDNGLWRILALVGRNSYCIYLIHVPYFRLLNKVGAPIQAQVPTLVWVGFAWVSAIIAGVLMTKMIENPMLKLRDRLFPARAKATVSLPEETASLDVPKAADAISFDRARGCSLATD